MYFTEWNAKSMIKSIHLKNWQSWESETIDFSDGLNVLLGISDSGKSALIRAIQWVVLCKNPGSANSFIRDGETSCMVGIDFDGFTVTRFGGSDRRYVLYKSTDDWQEFKAFKTSVPEPIQEAINMDFINFQSQHDTSFLFSSTSGEVAKLLNEIVDLDVIDHATANINSTIKEHENDVKYLKKDLEGLRESLEVNKLKHDLVKPDMDRANHLDSKLDKLNGKIGDIEKKKKNFERLESEIANTEISIAKYAKYKGISDLIEPVQGLVQNRASKQLEAMKIEKLIRDIDQVEDDLELSSLRLNKLNEKWEKNVGSDCPLCYGEGKI